MSLLGTRRPALLVAARDARRAKARSLLIVAMVALPVVALGFVDVMWRTAVPAVEEQLARDLGGAEAQIEVVSPPTTPVVQAPDPRNGRFVAVWDDRAELLTVDQLTRPAGTRLAFEPSTVVRVATVGGVARTAWVQADLGEPLAAGRWALTEGRIPAAAGEVTLTPALAERTGVPVGGSVTLEEPAGAYTVVGLVEQTGERGFEAVVAAPVSALPANGPVLDLAGARAFLVGAPVTWADVQALNAQGALVTSRAVVLDPPDSRAYEEAMGDWTSRGLEDYLVGVLAVAMVVGLSALIVVLLAGTAFAVGARRQAHALALVAATGGDQRDLRRIVLSSGLVLGLVAGVAGVVAAVALGAVVTWALRTFTWTSLGGFDVRPIELLAIAFVGVVTGLAAAWLPARQAGRLDVVAALRGRSGAPARSRRTPVMGVVLCLAGLALSLVGTGWVVSTTDLPLRQRYVAIIAVVAGAALVLLGLVMCSGALVSLVARAAPRLPLAGRLALRDADRHRSRSAPAVAAVLAAVSGAVGVMLYVAALDARDREQYTAGSPAGTATVDLVAYSYDEATGQDRTSYLDPAEVLEALGSSLPVSGSVAINQPVCGWTCDAIPVEIQRPDRAECTVPDTAVTPEEFAELAAGNPACAPPSLVDYWAVRGASSYAVGGAELLGLTGVDPPAEVESALADGAVVVTDPLLIDDGGQVTIAYLDSAGEPGERRVPAVAAPLDTMAFNAVLPTELARSLDLETRDTVLLLTLDGAVSTEAEDAAREALGTAFDEAGYLNVERGYANTYGIGLLALAAAAGLVTLGATGIATGLALTDARADHATLAAVGAPPRLRRRLAAAQAGFVGGLGVLLGVAAGVVPALSVLRASASLDVVWPWSQLLVVVVGIPLLASGLAYACTRSSVPLQRRSVA